MVTQKDIARALNISVMTVSRALRGDERIAQKTRQKVSETAHRLKYRPSHHSRMLRHGRIGAVGLLMPDNPGDKTAPYGIIDYMLGLNDYFVSKGQLLTLVKAPHFEKKDDSGLPRILAERCVEGLIVCLTGSHPICRVIDQENVPTVWLDSYRREEANCVLRDEEDASFIATQHLIDHGHRDIRFPAPLGEGHHPSAPLLEAGYRRAMRGAGLKERTIPYEHPSPKPAEDFKKALASPDKPTACVGMAIPTLCVTAARMGIRIPEELSLVAAGTFRAGRSIVIGLTHVTIDRYGMGYTAGEMLNALVETGIPQTTKIFRGELIRGSTVAGPRNSTP